LDGDSAVTRRVPNRWNEFGIGTIFILRRLLGFEIVATGFTTLTTVVSFLGGIHPIGIGVIGEYLERVYIEVKHRSHYLISRKWAL